MSLLAHLWQSTLCVGAAAGLAFAFRSTPARTRHSIWLCASLKFLTPFAVFTAAGAAIGAAGAPVAPFAAEWLGRAQWIWSLDVGGERPNSPFVRELTASWLVFVWGAGAAWLAASRWREWRALSTLIASSTPLESGRERDALTRACRASRITQIRLLRSESSVEPGLLGVFRPTLLWPAGLSDRLSDEELDAILRHEVCHADRRDNLSALIQVVIETLVWFHPAVWWVGNRMVRERERACDEEVLRMGTNERTYAEGIVKVCGFCLRAPAAFMAGVGGSTLASRIESILERKTPSSAGRAARLALAAVVMTAIGVPMATGAGAAYRAQEQQTVYRPGKEVSQPKLIKEVKPQYTAEAKQARIQGSVGLEAVVLDTGEVADVTVVKSLDTVYGLDDAAVGALKQWLFEPGKKDGKPVAVRVEVEMTFTLK
ncbi:MAG TPA: M56 family metallopeptidase [Vicinamibacterales bacterium]|nr:M56 family metallopeptidase [Vicinamibacterales bacterium]